jgi:protein TonB
MELATRAPAPRIEAALGVIAIHLFLLWALINGISQRLAPREEQSEPPPIHILPPPEPVEVEPPRPTVLNEPAPAEQASIRAPEPASPSPSAANEIVVPPPLVRPPLPVPSIAPSIGPGQGTAPTGSSAAGAGEGGSGTGGPSGSGAGSGGSGSGGTGAGGTSRAAGVPQRARQLAGSLTRADYPPEALRAGAEGTTRVRFTVNASGRVSDCAITTSSRNAALDAKVCSVLRERYRFDPARDSAGNAVAEERTQRFTWILP